MGGWTERGYDSQHPDILPAKPECGGDGPSPTAARRIKALGYVLGLHDNYQDIYRDRRPGTSLHPEETRRSA